jgi:DNA helicase-2/ATP-dependent DNA helicase PcrA
VARKDIVSVEPILKAQGANSWKVLQRTLSAVRKAVKPSEKLQCVLEGDCGPFLQSAFDDYEECVADVRRLSKYAENFGTTDEFLEYVQRACPVATRIEFEADTPDAVLLAAIADVRNFEFGTVFILGMAQDEFPNTAASVEPGEEHEERRAFYVAVTRARNRLYMLCPGRSHDLSPFLKELSGTYDLVDRTMRT